VSRLSLLPRQCPRKPTAAISLAAAELPSPEKQPIPHTEVTGDGPSLPSQQQRFYQYMHYADSDRVGRTEMDSGVGVMGAGWDGIDRDRMFSTPESFGPPSAFKSVGEALAVVPEGDSPFEVRYKTHGPHPNTPTATGPRKR
jgi:hypothetical protein